MKLFGRHSVDKRGCPFNRDRLGDGTQLNSERLPGLLSGSQRDSCCRVRLETRRLDSNGVNTNRHERKREVSALSSGLRRCRAGVLVRKRYRHSWYDGPCGVINGSVKCGRVRLRPTACRR